jgi:hypothetical protein
MDAAEAALLAPAFARMDREQVAMQEHLQELNHADWNGMAGERHRLRYKGRSGHTNSHRCVSGPA